MTWGLAEHIAAEEFGRFRGLLVGAGRAIGARRPGRRVPGAPLAPARPGRPGEPADHRRVPPGRRRRTPRSACTCSTWTAAGSTCTGTGRPTRTWSRSHWAERRPADHRAAPARSSTAWCWRSTRVPARPRCTPSWPTRAGWSRSRAPRRTCRTAGCWSAASWPTTGTTPAACSPTAPCSPRPSLYVRRVVGRLPAGHGPADLLVEASDGRAERAAPVPGPYRDRRRRWTPAGSPPTRAGTPAAVGGDALVVGAASLDHAGTRWTVRRGEREVGRAAVAGRDPAVRAAAGAGAGHRPAAADGGALPARPRHRPPAAGAAGRLRRPRAPGGASRPGPAWLERQWWADAGFAVVTIDNRGTPGVAPSLREGDPPAGGRRDPAPTRSDALHRARRQAPRPGPGPGGDPRLVVRRLAGRRWRCCATRTLFRCGIVGAPVTDWALYDTAYTERYLGLPDDGTDVYAHHSLVELAGEPPCRPGRRPGRCCWCTGWSTTTWWPRTRCGCPRRCCATGRPHAVLPLTGATHMAGRRRWPNACSAWNSTFLRTHLG